MATLWVWHCCISNHTYSTHDIIKQRVPQYPVFGPLLFSHLNELPQNINSKSNNIHFLHYTNTIPSDPTNQFVCWVCGNTTQVLYFVFHCHSCVCVIYMWICSDTELWVPVLINIIIYLFFFWFFILIRHYLWDSPISTTMYSLFIEWMSLVLQIAYSERTGARTPLHHNCLNGIITILNNGELCEEYVGRVL